jgi:archaemetzincin
MIYVAPIDLHLPGAVDAICRRLGDVFDCPIKVLATRIDAAVALDASRQQYNSTTLLAELLGVLPTPEAKILGLTSVDLFIPVLTYVFGEAQLDGNAALASSHRLRNELYGLPEAPGKAMERFEKECLHELGHAFGLKHCPDYSCVMHASTSVEDIDLKGSDYCRTCRQALGK